MNNQDNDSDRSSDGWIKWYCNMNGHEQLCEVDIDFIEDGFNLQGLRDKVEFQQESIEMITKTTNIDEDCLSNEKFIEVYQDAADLYGLIHARQVLTPKGLADMKRKQEEGRFGTCPRVNCERQAVLPVGISDELRQSRVKIFCPRCEDVQIPKTQQKMDLDGAQFGCTFPHLLLASFPTLVPDPPAKVYVPKIFGFKVVMRKGSKFTTNQQQRSQLKKSDVTDDNLTEDLNSKENDKENLKDEDDNQQNSQIEILPTKEKNGGIHLVDVENMRSTDEKNASENMQ